MTDFLGYVNTRTASRRRVAQLAHHLLLHPQTTMSTTTPQTVLITGVTSGLGRALSLELSKLGHQIIGCGRRQDKLDNLLQELNQVSPKEIHHLLLPCNVADKESVETFAKTVLDFHHIIPDVVFANAGVSITPAPLWDTTIENFEYIFRVNVTGVFHVLKYFIPPVLAASRLPGATYKRILATSSGLGHSTSPIAGSYSATKFSVEAMMKSVAQALAQEKNIGAWPLAPGVIQTEMMRNHQMPTASEWAKDAAPYILQLGDHESTKSGSSVSVPGYYSEEYMATWIIENGQQLPSSVVAPFVTKKKR